MNRRVLENKPRQLQILMKTIELTIFEKPGVRKKFNNMNKDQICRENLRYLFL